MSGLSKLGTALSVVFVVSLVALAAEIVYIFCRRRRAARQRAASGDGSDGLQPSRESLSTSSAAKHQLLYFLCWKHKSRVDPDGGDGAYQASAADGTLSQDAPEEVIDVLKLHAMRGPSRVLFTIKEEEKEEVESERSVSQSVVSAGRVRRVSLEECFSNDHGESPEVILTIMGNLEITPFTTPCDSPLYFTPSASPARDPV